MTVSLPPDQDAPLLDALRAGDERAFATLVDKYGPSLLRLAQLYVPSRAIAEEVVQETWLAVLTGVERFEGRSSLKTWLFRILTNKAKTQGGASGGSLPFSALAGDGDEDQTAVTPTGSPGAGPGRHRREGSPRSGCSPPRPRAHIEEAIAALPRTSAP